MDIYRSEPQSGRVGDRNSITQAR